jgi:hypothetical protein
MRGRLVASITVAVSLIAPAAAPAAAPVCSPATGLEAEVQAGEFINLPQAPCTDSDGDAISIEITQEPVHGTLDPAGTQPIGNPRTYTADADAGGQTDVIKFRAVAGAENSNEATLEIHITQNHAPVCPALVDVSVESGKPLVISQNPCTDADGDPLSFTIVDGPDHGTFTAPNPAGPFTYTSQAGYVGPDRVTYRASDASTQSNVGAVSITVTAPAGGGGGGGGGTSAPPVVTPDVTPPTLSLRPPSTALRRALRRGLTVRLRASEPARAQLRLLVSKRVARRLGIDRRAKKPVVIGRLTRSLSTSETKLAVKLTRKARRRLARVPSVKLTLEVTLTDAAGNVRRSSRVLTLR